MARQIPFVFCRYRILVDEEPLNAIGQRQAFIDMQGEPLPHGAERADKPRPAALIMEPDSFEIDGEMCLTVSVGLQPGFRVQTDYDKARARKRQRIVEDTHIKYADIVALPERGVMAVQDRAGDEHIPARQAIGALRTLVRTLGDSLGSLDVRHVEEQDVQRWLVSWDLQEYLYTITPLNPIRHTDLAQKRSDAMKRDNAAIEYGKIKPAEGQSMRANGGVVEEAHDLAAVGYGQEGFRGVTPDGHTAHVPKPTFYTDRHKNLAEREKPHFVRVLFDPPSPDERLSAAVAAALKRFYQ